MADFSFEFFSPPFFLLVQQKMQEIQKYDTRDQWSKFIQEIGLLAPCMMLVRTVLVR